MMIEEFWMDAYPEIDSIPNKVAQMQKAGYIPISTFILPEYCWIEHFYDPQVKVQEIFLQLIMSCNLSKTLLRISCSTNELANLGGGAISLAKSAWILP